MSASHESTNDAAHDGEHHEAHQPTFRSYMIGFVLSVILTIIPFYIVLGDVLDSATLAVSIIFILGAIQMMVHIYYFLHVTTQAEEGHIAMSMAFTVLLLVIVMSGSIWVMFHLEENMMPAHEQIERARSLP